MKVKPNNFDLARLLLAATVFLAHLWVASRQPALHFLCNVDSHGAVEGFFTISGFLIVASFERSKSPRDYFLKRAKRILPAYWLSTAFCVAIAVVFSRSFHVGKFLLANLTFMNFLHPGVSGVFQNNPDTVDLNAPLWTIKIEVAFYLIVPLLVWACRKLGYTSVLGTITVASIIYRLATSSNIHLAYQLPGQLSFFCIGALIYRNLTTFKRIGRWLVAPALLCYVAFSFTQWFVLRPLSIPVLVLFFCLSLPEIKGPTRWGDFSYGTYVLHFPIIQSLVALGAFQRFPILTAFLAAALTAQAAVLSWFFVERRWLRSRRIQVEAIPSLRLADAS
ncbi:MAG: acyltransferase [Acidobacteriaceae bacterium]|nr:acyltransferase [Acidobacteriaceae bacterium]